MVDVEPPHSPTLCLYTRQNTAILGVGTIRGKNLVYSGNLCCVGMLSDVAHPSLPSNYIKPCLASRRDNPVLPSKVSNCEDGLQDAEQPSPVYLGLINKYGSCKRQLQDVKQHHCHHGPNDKYGCCKRRLQDVEQRRRHPAAAPLGKILPI